MNPMLLSGSANPRLAATVAELLGVEVGASTHDRFPDGEAHVEVATNVRGRDVYVVQPTSPPADAHVVELLLLADACNRAGADRITAVIPYFGYARQDRRRGAGQAVGARVVSDLLGRSPVDRVLVVDPHTRSLEAMVGLPVDTVTGVDVLAEALRAHVDEECVLVAPDLGALKLAESYAARLQLPVAFVRKTRESGTVVHAHGVAGDVRGRVPVVVDDMITTGGTVVAAVEAVRAAGSRSDLVVAATHGVLAGAVHDALGALAPRSVLVTDTIEIGTATTLPLEVVSVAGVLAAGIDRLHRDRPLADVAVYR
jgi:ribose-phosphate pyrophosphokinase